MLPIRPTVPCLVLLLLGLLPAALAAQADDESHIRGMLQDLTVHWNARDADGWVSRFSEDSGFTNILGMHFADRVQNRDRHAFLFEGIFGESRLDAEVLDVRRIGSDAATAEVAFTLTGHQRLPPGIEETEPGVLRTRLITVLERRDGTWWIVAAQNTAIAPLP